MPTISPKPTPGTPPGNAKYDESLSIPKCSGDAPFCDSLDLLISRGAIGGKAEEHTPNTLDACTDGSTGTFGNDESVNNVKVSTVGGEDLAEGSTVKIEATVNAYSATADYADFFYTNNVNSPDWQFIATVNPTTSGLSTVSTTYTLPAGDLQAVRVAFR